MKFVGIIPARLGSSRLQHKLLHKFHGKEALRWTWEHLRNSGRIHGSYIVTDSERIRDLAASWGAPVIMTEEECESGTERIASALDRIDANVIVNIQADEVLLSTNTIDDIISAWTSDVRVLTPVYNITNAKSLCNPNVVKALMTTDNRLIAFSRAAIPFVRDLPFDEWILASRFWGHVGVYLYRRDILERWTSFPKHPYEAIEKLEQWRLLNANIRIDACIVPESISLNAAEDISYIEESLRYEL